MRSSRQNPHADNMLSMSASQLEHQQQVAVATALEVRTLLCSLCCNQARPASIPWHTQRDVVCTNATGVKQLNGLAAIGHEAGMLPVTSVWSPAELTCRFLPLPHANIHVQLLLAEDPKQQARLTSHARSLQHNLAHAAIAACSVLDSSSIADLADGHATPWTVQQVRRAALLLELEWVDSDAIVQVRRMSVSSHVSLLYSHKALPCGWRSPRCMCAGTVQQSTQQPWLGLMPSDLTWSAKSFGFVAHGWSPSDKYCSICLSVQCGISL